MNLIDRFKAARRAGVPLVAITSPDYTATQTALCKAIKGKSDTPKICWDLCRGFLALNKLGGEALAKIGIEDEDSAAARSAQPADALKEALKLDGEVIIFSHNFQRYLENEAVIQSILNVREAFKADRRTFVMLCVEITLPPELQQDVLVLDEPLPTDKELEQLVTGLFNDQEPKIPIPKDMDKITDALSGLSCFAAEQVTSMSINNDLTINRDELWERKRRMVEQTKGLRVYRSGFTFDDVGGMPQIKKRMKRLFAGPKPPRAILWMDEIEKMLAGSGGPSGDGGVGADALGVILKEMQENNWTGLIAVGPPGAGKTMLAKGTGNTFGVPTIEADIGATRDKFVGNSEQNIRQIFKVAKAMGRDSILFIATCNRLDAIPPELKRRFTKGIYFFDLPTKEERSDIWKMYLKKFGLADQKLPHDEGWTGANIFACCDAAWQEQCSLVEASESIIPVTRSDPEGLAKLRKMADGKFLSVNEPGPYRMNETTKGQGARRIGD